MRGYMIVAQNNLLNNMRQVFRQRFGDNEIITMLVEFVALVIYNEWTRRRFTPSI